MIRRRRHNSARGFSLVEAALSTIIVAIMFAAGMSAAGVAARDRRTQNEMRTGQQLARMLAAEIAQQRYADPSANTIAPASGVSGSDRSNWNHIDDYAGFRESPPRNRAGGAVSGASGWTWQANIAYLPVGSFSTTTAAPSGSTGVVGGLLGVVAGVVSSVIDPTTTAPADTGLKSIVVTVKAPSGKVTTLTAMRSSAGAVDRVSQGSGFHSWASVGMTIGNDQRAVQTGAPLLNDPAIP